MPNVPQFINICKFLTKKCWCESAISCQWPLIYILLQIFLLCPDAHFKLYFAPLWCSLLEITSDHQLSWPPFIRHWRVFSHVSKFLWKSSANRIHFKEICAQVWPLTVSISVILINISETQNLVGLSFIPHMKLYSTDALYCLLPLCKTSKTFNAGLLRKSPTLFLTHNPRIKIFSSKFQPSPFCTLFDT